MLLGGAAAAWPLAARAQQAGKTPRVGYIRAGTPNDDQVREEFVRGMRDLGYIEGRNITYEFRHYGDDVESIPSLRKEEYRERQCRANRQQHHKLSKPSTSHDM
jgi:putative tryptophan/tyrosine transport system substrate-binding protein